MADYRFIDTVKEFAAAGKPVFGTCAGLIVMADRVNGKKQDLLNLIDIDVERNAYGRQVDSREADIPCQSLGEGALSCGFHPGPADSGHRPRRGGTRPLPGTRSCSPGRKTSSWPRFTPS